MPGLWFEESYTQDLSFSYRVKQVLFSGKTRFQKVDVIELAALGKTLFLDNRMQSAQLDEALYHEFLVHPAMQTHPGPKSVFIAGGGEGATLREVLRYPGVDRAVMVDIDQELVEVCRRHLPEWSSGAFDDHRAELVFADARARLEQDDSFYDVVISDLSEPWEGGESALLFTKEFYQLVYRRLDDEGVFVAQVGAGDPLFPDLAASVVKTLAEVFPVVRLYTVFVFSFFLPWAFVIATKAPQPDPAACKPLAGTRHFDRVSFASALGLPKQLREALRVKGRVLTDKDPFVWNA